MNKRLRQNNLNNHGFTIIETLVAIAILMISIAGPLAVASKSLTAALYAKDQMTASYLVQEGVEHFRNLKDNNPNLGNNGIGWYSSILGGNCKTSNNSCDLLVDDPVYDSQFTRKYYYITFSGNNDEIALTVFVTWKHGTVDNETSITTELTNTAL